MIQFDDNFERTTEVYEEMQRLPRLRLSSIVEKVLNWRHKFNKRNLIKEIVKKFIFFKFKALVLVKEI